MTDTQFDDRPPDRLTIDRILQNRAERLGAEPYAFYGPEDREVSFAETNRIANSIGNALDGLGVDHQEVVSVMVRDPLRTLLTFYGLQKRGAVYSPVNYEFRGQTLSYQLIDTRPETLIVEDRYVDRLNAVREDLDVLPHVVVSETGADAERLDPAFSRSSFDELLAGSTAEPGATVEWHDTASILYTSGTTGDPKGVVQQHRWAITNQSEFVWRFVSTEDVVHSPLPLHHIGGLYSTAVGSLIAGGSVALWNEFSSSEFWDRVERYGATQVMLLGSMIPWLANAPERADDHRNTINKVTMIPLVEDHVEIAERFGFDTVLSVYGSTEVGAPLAGMVHAAKGENATPEDVQRGLSTAAVLDRARDLGVPVVDEAPGQGWVGDARWKSGTVSVAVVDDLDERVPAGTTGELVLRPERPGTIFEEYRGDPARTVEAWRNLWYHTGDLLSRDDEGHFYFVDRKGDVIRRRGENISSGQVQDIVNSLDGVERSAAFPVPAEEGGEDELAVAVEPTEGSTIAEAEFRAALREEVPEFMVPKLVTVVDEIPTTETNKMEKYKLREDLLDRESDDR